MNGKKHWKFYIQQITFLNLQEDFVLHLVKRLVFLGLIEDPISIENIEKNIVERGFEEGWIVPQPPKERTGKKVAVVGSGPAGLAAAQQLNRAGHLVTVFERDDAIGGLLRYGIPNFKLEKEIIDRRLDILKEEGIIFKTNVNVGVNYSVEKLKEF